MNDFSSLSSNGVTDVITVDLQNLDALTAKTTSQKEGCLQQVQHVVDSRQSAYVVVVSGRASATAQTQVFSVEVGCFLPEI